MSLLLNPLCLGGKPNLQPESGNLVLAKSSLDGSFLLSSVMFPSVVDSSDIIILGDADLFLVRSSDSSQDKIGVKLV